MIASVFARVDSTKRALSIAQTEERILLLCTRQEFGGRHIQAVSSLAERPVDWEGVFVIADAQGVSPLVGRNLQRCRAATGLSMPDSVVTAFNLASQEIVHLKERANVALERILAFLSDRGLEVMLLTSAQADRSIYHNPALTFGRDLDLLIRAMPNQLPPVLLARIAAFFTAQSSLFADFVAGFGYEYEFFEYDYYAHHDLTLNETLPFDFAEVWRDSIPCQSPQGQPYRLMCPEDLLISLCISSFRKRYFRLKNLLDVAECANVLSKHPDVAWRLDWGRLAARARSYNAQSIVYAALLSARQHLQASLPAKATLEMESAVPNARVIRWLVQHRSFSRLCDYNSEYQPLSSESQAPHSCRGLALELPSASSRRALPLMTSRPKRDLTLLLPLASYRPAQFVRKLRYVARGRSRASDRLS